MEQTPRPSAKDLVVVKVGTNTLTRRDEGMHILDEASFERIGAEVQVLSEEGNAVVVVSSGAITAGALREQRRREEVTNVHELQYLAAMGWSSEIVPRWQAAIGERPVMPALLTKHELNTSATLESAMGVAAFCLLEREGVLLVNENDTISDSEIKFGDNDTLAGVLTQKLALSGLYRAARLVLLTDTDGLRRNVDDPGSFIRTVYDIDVAEKFAGDARSGHARGGMITKMTAARMAKQVDAQTHIANGREAVPVQRALAGEIGTHFPIQGVEADGRAYE